MLSDMKKILLILFFTANVASAGLYKWKDADGNTHYTDRKPAETDQFEIVPELVIRAGGRDPLAPQAPYEQFIISSPAENEIIRSSGDAVDVSVDITPPLTEDNFLQLYVDGSKAGDKTKTTRLTIQQLGKGIHRLSAEIVDDSDAVVMSAGTVSFEFRDEVEAGLPAPQ
jgi:hypothetical protein